MSDSLKLVRQLREMTGAGILDCKKYLEQTNNNLDDAVKLFRTESGKKAEKKSSRIAAEGLVNYFENSKSILILELNSETDFVAKNDDFKGFVGQIANHLVGSSASDVTALKEEKLGATTVQETVQELTLKIGPKRLKPSVAIENI